MLTWGHPWFIKQRLHFHMGMKTAHAKRLDSRMRMSNLLPPTLFACFLASMSGCCRAGDDARVQAEPNPPVPSASAMSVQAPVEVVVSASAEAPAVASAEPMPEPSGSAEVVQGPPKRPPPIPLPRLRPLATQEVVAVVVRSKPKAGAPAEEWTRLIHADGKTTSKKGAYLFIRGQLHQYRRRENVSPNPPCAPGDNLFPKRIWRNAEFVPEKNGKTIEIIPAYKPNPKSEEIVHVETDHELVAALPGFAFIKSSETDYGCGAHPLYGNAFVLVAFGTDGAVEKISESEYLDGTDAWIDHAMAKFNAQSDPAESPDSLDARIQNSSDVKAVMAYPMITAKGAVWGGLFTAPATWAGSYGGWAGYTRAIPMAMNKTPKRFRDAMVTPEPVNEYVSKHEKDEDILGFTVGDVANE